MVEWSLGKLIFEQEIQRITTPGNQWTFPFHDNHCQSITRPEQSSHITQWISKESFVSTGSQGIFPKLEIYRRKTPEINNQGRNS